MERAIGDRVSREPVLSVDLFAVGLEFRELLVTPLLQQTRRPSVCLDDHQILVVHPDFAGKVTLPLLHRFRLNGKHVAWDFIRLLSSQVTDVIIADILRCKYERQYVPQILLVCGRYLDQAKRRSRGAYHSFRPFSFVRKRDIRSDLKPAAGSSAFLELLHLGGLPVSVILPRLGE